MMINTIATQWVRDPVEVARQALPAACNCPSCNGPMCVGEDEACGICTCCYFNEINELPPVELEG